MPNQFIPKNRLNVRRLVESGAPSLPAFTNADLARAIRKSKPRPDPLGKAMGEEAWARPLKGDTLNHRFKQAEE